MKEYKVARKGIIRDQQEYLLNFLKWMTNYEGDIFEIIQTVFPPKAASYMIDKFQKIQVECFDVDNPLEVMYKFYLSLHEINQRKILHFINTTYDHMGRYEQECKPYIPPDLSEPYNEFDYVLINDLEGILWVRRIIFPKMKSKFTDLLEDLWDIEILENEIAPPTVLDDAYINMIKFAKEYAKNQSSDQLT